MNYLHHSATWRGWLLASVILAGGVVALSPCRVACQEVSNARSINVEDVRVAWSKYWEGVEAFQYQFDLQRTIAAGDPPTIPGDPFGRVAGTQRSRARFSLSGEKLAYRTEHQNGSKVFVFDGSTTRSLHSGFTAIPLGQILDSKHPSAALTRHAENLPLWLGYKPAEMLERLGFSAENIRLGRLDVVRNRVNCLELKLSRTTSLFVDPARNCLVVGLLQVNDGATRRDLKIEYVAHDQVGWVVSEWDDQHFGSREIISGRDVKCLINQAIADEEFNVEFPVGTYIARIDSELPPDVTPKYFVQTKAGALNQITDREYGVVP